MRWLAAAAVAAAVLVGCAHPLEIRNLDRYRSPADGEPLERQTSIGMMVSAPDADTLRVAKSIGTALGRYSARVVQPYAPGGAGNVEVVARISVTPRYEGAGSNWFVNLPGLLVLAPTWNGYAYTVGYDFQILLTRAWDNGKLDAWTLPVSLDIRHSSGMLWDPGYNPEVTEPAVALAGEPVGDYVARDIVRHLNSEGRLWKLAPPPDWAAPATPAPAAAPALGILVKGAMATLKPGATMRTRPRPDGDVVDVPAGGSVKLGPNLKNATGSWWYVTGSKNGWVLEGELSVH